MRELAASGYLSNRLRQVVASYLIHDLGGDWRAGAALVRGATARLRRLQQPGQLAVHRWARHRPTRGRRFNPSKQAATYDPDGTYQRLWGTA